MTLRTLDGLDWLPRSFGIVYAVGFGTVFIMAVMRHDVSPYMPLISETGAKPPESGLFTITTHIMATIGAAIIVLRYLITEECNHLILNRFITRMSKISLTIGLISMFALVVAGSCTMMIMKIPHGVAAIFLFLGCLLYGLLETVTTYEMVPDHASKFIFVTRAGIVSMASIVLLIMISVATKGRKIYNILFPANNEEWTGCKTPGEEGFAYVIVISTGEWLLSLLWVAYFFTFIFEFRGSSFYIDTRQSRSTSADRESTPDIEAAKSSCEST